MGMPSSILSNGTEARRDFPRDGLEAGVAFLKSFIQLLLGGFRSQRFFDERLVCEKSWRRWVSWVAPVGKKSLARGGIFP